MHRAAAARVATIYGVVATVWIFSSDRLALAVFGDAVRLTGVQTVKGLVFVLVSAVLIHLLVRRERSRWIAAEQSAAGQAQRFEAIFRSSPAGILIADLETRRFLDANDRLLQMFGYTRDEVVGRSGEEVALWADPDERLDRGKRLSELGQLNDTIDLFRHADGSLRTMLWSAEVVEFEQRKRLITTLVDVTDRTRAYDETLQGWAHALDLRDQDTADHAQRVTELTLALGRRLGLDATELVEARRGALLHDVGKIGVPDAILNKPGPLNDEEWEVMRRHPVIARDLLAPIDYLRDALAIPAHHHERWDGTGYPDGLAGEEIPFAARIFAVVDVWDALTNDRPYRSAWSRAAALAQIERDAGRHFDPVCVRAFVELVREGGA